MNIITMDSFTKDFVASKNKKFDREILTVSQNAFIITANSDPDDCCETAQLIFEPWFDEDSWEITVTSVDGAWGDVWKINTMTEGLLDNLMELASTISSPDGFSEWLSTHPEVERQKDLDF